MDLVDKGRPWDRAVLGYHKLFSRREGARNSAGTPVICRFWVPKMSPFRPLSLPWSHRALDLGFLTANFFHLLSISAGLGVLFSCFPVTAYLNSGKLALVSKPGISKLIRVTVYSLIIGTFFQFGTVIQAPGSHCFWSSLLTPPGKCG